MPKTQRPPPLITQEELAALMAPPPQTSSSGGDRGFKYRLIFLLGMVTTQTIRLLLFPHLAVANFQLHAVDEQSFNRYITARAVFIIVISFLYLYSYLKDRYFEQISLLYVGIAVTALVMDYFNAYIYFSDQPEQITTGLFVLRFLAIYCLFMNAWRVREAPPMPRSLWS